MFFYIVCSLFCLWFFMFFLSRFRCRCFINCLMENDTKMVPKINPWVTFSAKKAPKVLKMYAKRVPKWGQNGLLKHCFFILYEKGQNAPDPWFSHIIRGSGHFKCMQNRYEINIKSMPEKGMQKVWNMMQKLTSNGCQNRSTISKIMKKGIPKIDAEIWCWKKGPLVFRLGILDWIFGGLGEGGWQNSGKIPGLIFTPV